VTFAQLTNDRTKIGTAAWAMRRLEHHFDIVQLLLVQPLRLATRFTVPLLPLSPPWVAQAPLSRFGLRSQNCAVRRRTPVENRNLRAGEQLLSAQTQQPGRAMPQSAQSTTLMTDTLSLAEVSAYSMQCLSPPTPLLSPRAG